MNKALFAAGLVLMLAAPAIAETTHPTSLGLDFEMPYSLKANGASTNVRGALNVGIDGRWWADDNMNYGARLSFDLENKGIARQIVLAPGLQYHFMDVKSAVRPFLRADLPITLRGVANTDGSANKQDVGIAGGLGVALNLGEMVGVQNLALRYDFDFGYNFGLGPAVTQLYVNFFKIGFDYKF